MEKGSPFILYCRYDHSFDYKVINVVDRGPRRTNPLVLSSADYNPRPISKAKKTDFIKPNNASHIPEELHPWYNNLPSTDFNGPERLPKTDENESGDEY